MRENTLLASPEVTLISTKWLDDGEGDPLLPMLTVNVDMPELVVVGIDNERRLVCSQMEKSCSCLQACYSQVNEGEIYSIHFSMLELQRVKKKLFGKLQMLANATDVIHHLMQEVNVQCRCTCMNRSVQTYGLKFKLSPVLALTQH